MIDIDKLEALAKAAGSDAWTPTYATRTDLAKVWLPDGDLLCHCYGNIGHQPEPIDADDVAEYIGAVSPANVLALIAEVRRLRTLLDNRPALNAGLIEAYTLWTAGVYASDAAAFSGETKQ